MRLYLLIICILLLSFVSFANSDSDIEPLIDLGSISEQQINSAINSLSTDDLPAKRVAKISAIFLGIPYGGGKLESFDGVSEHLVVDFTSLDCFTFLDYVEALRLSSDYNQFIDNLKHVRYKHGVVGHLHRNHFFTDWVAGNHVTDITEKIGGEYSVSETKILNQKSNGKNYVNDIGIVERTVTYIPANLLLKHNIIEEIQTGDYIGIFTEKKGLDVSHVGIALYDGGRLILRHASSSKSNMKVLDQDFRQYISKVKGVLVIRPNLVVNAVTNCEY